MKCLLYLIVNCQLEYHPCLNAAHQHCAVNNMKKNTHGSLSENGIFIFKSLHEENWKWCFWECKNAESL